MLLTLSNEETFEDTKGLIRDRRVKNGQKKNGKRTDNDLQNTTKKTND